MQSSPSEFVALVPVKSLVRAKSRLAGLPEGDRRSLALAFALDTLAAVRATPGVGAVVVVTADSEMADLARADGCGVVGDHGDLNASLRAAAVGAHRRLVAVCADLPALRSTDLAAALSQMASGPAAYVADHEGTGTTAYAAAVSDFDPRFGPGSAAAHAAAGARPVAGELITLRHDVDTLEDLIELDHAGLLGAHTRTLVPETARWRTP